MWLDNFFSFRSLDEPSYVVKIPKDLLDKIKNGTAKILTDKNGDLLPTIYDLKAKKAAGFVRLVEKPDESLSNIDCEPIMQFVNLLQHQEMMAKLLDIQDTVKCIALGQKNDRFAEVLSGSQQVFQALDMKNVRHRNAVLVNAIQTLNESREKVYFALLELLKTVPKHIANDYVDVLGKEYPNPAAIAQALCIPWAEKAEKTYREIQECYYFYYKATEALVMAHMFLGEPVAAANTLNSNRELFEQPELEYLRKLEPLVGDCGVDYAKLWYNGIADDMKAALGVAQCGDNCYILMNKTQIQEVKQNAKRNKTEKNHRGIHDR